ncbi:MAG: DUF4091 domain-containing protein [Oscillospiraceae bacterium]|jgi:hypothetical protein|nr:DUF4091 domain-containing protein [Oscillospiraceae bacterium]
MATIIRCCSSLEKIFSDQAPAGGFAGGSCLLGEWFSFQVAVQTGQDALLRAEIDGLEGAALEAFWVEEIPVQLPCYEDSDDDYLRKTPGRYPDLLRAMDGAGERFAEAEAWQALWVSVRPETPEPRTITVTIRDDARGETVRAEVALAPLPARLPPQALRCTLWFHADCLATWYDVPVFSEPHWAILERYIRAAAEHGVTLLLTPLFTPPLDTEVGTERPTVQLVDIVRDAERYFFDFSRLGRWFDLCQSCGIREFELSHLFTQWGAKAAPKIMGTVDGQFCRLFGWETDADSPDYAGFLAQFAAALLPFLERKGVRDRCWMHVSDEPGADDLDSYARHSALLHRLFPGIPVMDAMSDLAFYEQGLLEQPIPANNHAQAFVGKVPDLWTYYCCGQHADGVSNRFFAMPSRRNRVLGFQLWKYRCGGFLQWGYNFWYACLSRERINPFLIPDGGGAWPAGDPFVVYPGEDGGPLPSLRLKVFREALQDQRALRLLEELVGYDRTLQMLEEGPIAPLTFHCYPSDDAWLRETRERINRTVAAALREREV